MAELYRNAISKNSLDYFGKNLKGLTNLVKAKSEKLKKLTNEISKEKVNREAWRLLFVPPYFESEWGRAFIEAAQNNNNNNNFMQTSENFTNQVDSNRKEIQRSDGLRN